jgi:hypothetical protein
MSDSPKTASAWAPLRQSLFRSLWIASVVSNIGAWMEDVGEAWLMTSQTLSPLLVALLQTAESRLEPIDLDWAGLLAEIRVRP